MKTLSKRVYRGVPPPVDAFLERSLHALIFDVYSNQYHNTFSTMLSPDLTMMSSTSSVSSASTRAPRVYRTSVFSRERNRMHARKTRQRKKEHMQKLQNRADELKLEQIRLKQAINEKNTASILVGLFQSEGDSAESNTGMAIDPKVDELLKRPSEDIPDASKIPELPALILPGQHNGKRKSTDGEADIPPSPGIGEGNSAPEELEEDGIDYALLGKDRSACSPAELDQIRRERNRMHAKRTRDRKRIFMEEMEVMIKELEDENLLLQSHVNKLNANQPAGAEGTSAAAISFPPAISPELAPLSAPSSSTAADTTRHPPAHESNENEQPSTKGDFLNQIESLLAAAGSFQKKRSQCEINAISCAESDVTASTNHSDHHSLCEEEDEHNHQLSHPNKRQRTSDDLPTSVPKSITTMTNKLHTPTTPLAPHSSHAATHTFHCPSIEGL